MCSLHFKPNMEPAARSLHFILTDCYPRRGGRAWNEVGTLIRNINLESNFLTLRIGTQFKVSHLGIRFSVQTSRSPQEQEFRAI